MERKVGGWGTWLGCNGGKGPSPHAGLWMDAGSVCWSPIRVSYSLVTGGPCWSPQTIPWLTYLGPFLVAGLLWRCSQDNWISFSDVPLRYSHSYGQDWLRHPVPWHSVTADISYGHLLCYLWVLTMHTGTSGGSGTKPESLHSPIFTVLSNQGSYGQVDAGQSKTFLSLKVQDRNLHLPSSTLTRPAHLLLSKTMR